MRKLPVAITLVAALALSACGEENPPTQIEKPADLDAEPEVFFAMKPCTCYEYAPEEEWAEGRQEFSAMLGVAVENLGAEVQFGRQLHIVRYRVSGTLNRVIRQEFLEPTDPELLLWGVNPTGEHNAPIWKFDPPASYVRGPVREDVAISTDVQTTRHTPPDEDQEGPRIRLVAQYRRPAEQVTIGVWDEVTRKFEPADVKAVPIHYTHTGSELQTGIWKGFTRWFAVGSEEGEAPLVRGFVKMSFDLEGQPTSWVLVNVRELEECTPTGAEPLDHCGS